jgi:acyl-CoA dehydrogenase
MSESLNLDLRIGALAGLVDDRYNKLVAQLQALVHDPVLAHEPSDDAQARIHARKLVRVFADHGLHQWIEDSDFIALALIREALAWANPLADAIFALQALGSMPVLLGGDERTRASMQKALRSGESILGFAMTEAVAGSDVANLATTAVEVDGGYRLVGEKTLISNAGLADYYVVFATTAPEKKSRGISCFLVDARTPGVRFIGPQILSAPHPLGQMSFDCQVEAHTLVGARDRGFSLGMASLDRLRPTVAAAACGMARRALDEALGRTKSRVSFGKPLRDLPQVQAELAKMALDLDASRLLTYRAAQTCSLGGDALTLHAAMAKAYATEAAQSIVDRALQLHGGVGCLASSRVDLLYRSIRALRIYEGATEIQHLVIARHIH